VPFSKPKLHHFSGHYLKFDLEFIKTKYKSITPIVVTNGKDVINQIGGGTEVKAGVDTIFEVKK